MENLVKHFPFTENLRTELQNESQHKGLTLILIALFFCTYQNIITSFSGYPVFTVVLFTVLFFIYIIDKIHLKKIFRSIILISFLFILLITFFHFLFSSTLSPGGVYKYFIFLPLFTGIAFPPTRRFALILIGLFSSINLYFKLSFISITQAGDMLAYITNASRILLENGNPYLSPVIMSGYEYKNFAYGPFFLVLYAPFIAENLDLRLVNIISLLAISIFFSFITKNNLFRFLFFFGIIINPWLLYLILTKHIFFYGVLLIFISYGFGKNNVFISSSLSTLAVLTRPFSIALAFFEWIDMKGIWRKGLWILFSGVIAFLIFFVIDQENFFNTAFSAFLPKTGHLVNHFDETPVKFGARMSPGTGSGYNLAHVLKFIVPWKAKYYYLIILISLTILLISFFKRRIDSKWCQYIFYLVFIAFAYNYSPYMIWGVLSCGIGVILHFGDFGKSRDSSQTTGISES